MVDLLELVVGLIFHLSYPFNNSVQGKVTGAVYF